MPGSSENATARTPRAALRRTSSAASCASHSGTMHNGTSRPPESPAHSSTIQSLYARTHASASSLSAALGEDLAAEAREGGEAQRRLHVVEVHVGEARLGVVATLAHLVEADRPHPPLGLVVPRARVEHLVAPLEVFVDPPVGLGPVAALAEDLVPLDPLDGRPVADDLGAAVAVLRGKPRLPHVRRLDDVVVDRDDHRDLALAHPISIHDDLSWVFSSTLSHPESRP